MPSSDLDGAARTCGLDGNGQLSSPELRDDVMTMTTHVGSLLLAAHRVVRRAPRSTCIYAPRGVPLRRGRRITSGRRKKERKNERALPGCNRH